MQVYFGKMFKMLDLMFWTFTLTKFLTPTII